MSDASDGRVLSDADRGVIASAACGALRSLDVSDVRLGEVIDAGSSRSLVMRGLRERRVRRFDLGRLELDLAGRLEQRDRLAERLGDRDAVTARAAELQEQRNELARKHREVRARLIAEEIERNPDWLKNTLGPEPEQSRLRHRWQQSARHLAGYRLEHEITDPDHALGQREVSGTSARAAQRAITDTLRRARTRRPVRRPGPRVGAGVRPNSNSARAARKKSCGS